MREDVPQLGPNEIDKLFQFVKGKYVRYRDVQYEIVDHLATAIEEIQRINPEITFTDALAKVYARFPVTGFAQLVAIKQKQMNRYWTRRIGRWLLQYFRPPQVIVTFGLSGLFYCILHFTGAMGILGMLLFIWLLAVVLRSKSPHDRQFENPERRKYLVIDSFYNTVPMALAQPIGFLWGFVQFVDDIRFEYIPVSDTIIIPLSIFLAFYCILTYAANYIFPYWLEEEIEERYGHLEFV